MEPSAIHYRDGHRNGYGQIVAGTLPIVTWGVTILSYFDSVPLGSDQSTFGANLRRPILKIHIPSIIFPLVTSRRGGLNARENKARAFRPGTIELSKCDLKGHENIRDAIFSRHFQGAVPLLSIFSQALKALGFVLRDFQPLK